MHNAFDFSDGSHADAIYNKLKLELKKQQQKKSKTIIVIPEMTEIVNNMDEQMKNIRRK